MRKIRYMDEKGTRYQTLVSERKTCQSCNGLTNPAIIANGYYDSEEIGPWSHWQGNLNSSVMLIGQDWGDVSAFLKQEGLESDTNETNKNLQKLFGEIGIRIKLPSKVIGKGSLFFTNAILCMKRGGASAEVKSEWFRNCGSRFLHPLVELIHPQVVICLGEWAYKALIDAYSIPRLTFREAVEHGQPIELPIGSLAFPVYHCSRRVINVNRNWNQQKEDWHTIQSYIHLQPTEEPQ